MTTDSMQRPTAGDGRRDRRRVGSFVGLVVSRLGPRALQLVGGTFLTLLVASRTTSALAITFAVTAHRLFLWLVYPLVGNLSDRTDTRVGRRVPYMAGALFAMAGFTWLWTVAPGYWPLVAVILGTRLAASANQMTSIVAVPEVFGRSRWVRAGASIWVVGFGVSVVLRGTVVATWDDADPATWNTTFRLAALFMAVAGAAVLIFVREAPGVASATAPEDHGRFRDRLRDFWSAPDARPLIVTTMALAVAGGATSRLFPVYAEEVLGTSAAQLAILPFVVLPAAACSAVAGAALASRLSRRGWVVLVGAAVLMASLVGMSATSLWQPVVASVLVTGVLVAESISLLPMLLRLLPERGSLGERLGLLAGPVSAAAVVGAYASGLLVDAAGTYRSMWWVGIVAGPVVALSAAGLRAEQARRRGGLSTLARAARANGAGRRRGGVANRGLFTGELDASDLDATQAVTALRDFADAALMDQGQPTAKVIRLIDLLSSDLGTSNSLHDTVVLVDEHGARHEGSAQVGAHLDGLHQRALQPWRPVDHPEGSAVVAPVSDTESVLVISSGAGEEHLDLRVRRLDHHDGATSIHPVQVDLDAIRRRHGMRRRWRRVALTAVRHFAAPLLRRATRQPVTRVEWARRARGAFADLGGAYVKFGQLLASSPSFVGAEAAEELRGLLDDAPPVPFTDVRAAIAAGLGSDVDALFASIDPEPIGAASLAVVHRAVLPTGEVVAVKVLRPGVAATVAADLELLERLATRAAAAGVAIADGLTRAIGFLRIQMAEELDLLNERRSLEHARRRFAAAGFDLVNAPAVHAELCSDTVLTMEFLDGVPLDTRAVDGASVQAVSAAVDQAIKAWFLTAVRDGWFHGDVHAGNLLALRDGRVAFVDWGVTGRLSPSARHLLRDLLGASLDVPGARDRLLDRLAAQAGIDPDAMGPVVRQVLGDRVTGLLTTPFGQSRLGELLDGGPLGGDTDSGSTLGQPRGGAGLDRSMFLLAKQLVYFERYGTVHLTGSHLLADRAFFEALLDDGADDAAIVAAGWASPLPEVPPAGIEAVGKADARIEPPPPPPPRGRRAAVVSGLGPALVIVAGTWLLWPTPSGILLQGALVGALTALTSLGLALVWRAKRVVNFAQGDLGAPVAVATVLAVLATPLPLWVALPLGFLAALASGALVDWLVIRRFDRSPRLVVTVATIGLAQLLAGIAALLPLRVEPEVLARQFPVVFPGDVRIGSVRFDSNDLMIAVVVGAVLAWLGWILQRTRLGLAIRASAQLPERAATLGLSVRGTQAAVWVIATGLSFLAVFLRVGTVGVPIGQVLGPGILLRALAAFVLAPRDRLWPIVAAAVGLGVLETSITYTADDASVVEPILAGIIAVGLLARRPQRHDCADADATSAWLSPMSATGGLAAAMRGPRARRVVLPVAVVVAGLLVGAPLVLDASRTAAMTAVLCLALAATSLVVVSGWSGHLSLGQLAFAGVGGVVVAWASASGSNEPLLVLVAATAAGAISAAVAGVPAFRARGVLYSVATLAFGVAASATVLNPGWATWIPTGSVPRGELAGFVDLGDEQAFYWFTLAVVIAAAAGLWSLGRHHTGRVLRAVRDNSPAAEAFGVNARVATLTGFAVAGGIAGLAGGLLVLQQQSFVPSLFAPTESLRLLTAAVTGGLDSVGGALFGASFLYGIEWLSPSAASWLRLASSGVGVLLVLLVVPRGLGPAIAARFHRCAASPDDQPWLDIPRPTAVEADADARPAIPASRGGARHALAVTGLSVDIGNLRILHDIDLTVDEGEVVALVGTNGAGKSTLLDAVAGITASSGGQIDLGGVDHTTTSPQQRAGAGLVHVPGGKAVFPDLTVAEHLDLAAWLRGPTSPTNRIQDQAVVSELLPQVVGLLHRRAGELSGGQQQLLSIAMALVASPKVLLIDELSLGLAPSVVAELVEVVDQLRARGIAVVLVEQSIPTALEIADRVVFLEKGTVRFEGRPAELIERPDLLRSVYLTDVAGASARPIRTAPERIVLRAEGLARSFGGIVAVGEVSLEVGTGEIVGLIGPNGAGKTTALDLLSGLHRPDSGTVWLNGRRIDRLPPARRARLGIVRSFQDARLFPSLTAVESVAVSLQLDARWTDPVLAAIHFPTAVDADRQLLARARTLLEDNGLGHYADAPIRALSTGVRRIVDLACVSGRQPHLVLLDEPAAGIAGAELDGLAARILALRDATGAAIVVVEHDLELIAAVSDRLIAMAAGRVLAEGPPQAVLTNPDVEASYLGTKLTGVPTDELVS